MAMGFNFAREPFVNERLPRLVFGLAVFLVALATGIHGLFLSRYLMREQEELDVRVEELREEVGQTNESIARTESALSREQTALGDERTQFLTGLFRRKAFSWTGLFNELEEITPPAVRITSISPFEDDEQISVTLTVVGRTLQDVLEMVRALESSSFFATVFPVEESNLDDAQRSETGIAATLELEYVEDARRNGNPPRESAEPSDSPEPSESTEPAEPSMDEEEKEPTPPKGAPQEAPR
jgi:Tfp pilus assembly protein PilN